MIFFKAFQVAKDQRQPLSVFLIWLNHGKTYVKSMCVTFPSNSMGSLVPLLFCY